ncbi:MAG: hypothetical protein L6243_06290 [Candidatus Altiarchaeales archaeon]|nr:hypothetical protein [Candidatus Altiarchaeota archaeon]MBU4341004.1 hypothetical protein [Candidatus Altiarchaeota archaeon]MBU4405995.1 hypothetical protein [Candidatus Altiarchaeota archaeon]MBU4437028.1 hypothetical protein [Candidatus Altiarchaeota archaeon]MCG2783179.1 hypothetical protein [Candidatus Altiarchaeales archaeon]
MIELTRKNLEIIIRILDKGSSKWSILEIQKDSALSYGAVWNLIKKLEKAGYVAKDNGLYKLTNRNVLISQAASLNPIGTKEKIEYYGGGTAKDRMGFIRNTATENKKDYALTLFAATDVIQPYVKSESVQAYIRSKDRKFWEKKSKESGYSPVHGTRGNLTLMPVEEDYYFALSGEYSGYKMVCIPQLVVDLISLGGPGEEQAKLIKERFMA